MSLFIKNIILFCIVFLLFGEVITRVCYATSDIPSRVIDENKIQKYNPNQTGYWVGGTHSWQINEDGWPGQLPKSKNNLITIIGDSYVENFMNPDSCRQSVLLQTMMPDFNFYEASRSGVSFIEAMEIASKLDTLKPIHQLIYVHDGDFTESSALLRKMSDITQYNSKTNTIVPGKLNSPGIKKILYNWKFIYYLYSNYPLKKKVPNPTKPKVSHSNKNSLNEKQINEIHKLISFTNDHYNKENITFVFRPKPNKKIISILKDFNFNFFILIDNNEKEWSFDHDPHWTCVGHEEAATQISKNLEQFYNNNQF
ncbi:hypothetical protein [Maribacter sp. Asnod1-A12]|uniref:hypothetical protein n=1 Tax=Maribacter sp. Asnod1-A12 TaxID=3160576 RepID=UPI00386F5DDD